MPLSRHVAAALIIRFGLDLTLQNLWSLSPLHKEFALFSGLFLFINFYLYCRPYLSNETVSYIFGSELKSDVFCCTGTCVLGCYLSRVLQWTPAPSSPQNTALLAWKGS